MHSGAAKQRRLSMLLRDRCLGSRDQRRLMLCSRGTDLRRELSPPLTWDKRSELYLSFIIRSAETETRLALPERRAPGQDHSASNRSPIGSFIANRVGA